ncbi:hypothetical protein NDU88_007319 [Pleurodeles waltl]|uniref:Uncharacterized protein n=1 Tax=Pleurodeles waltl TaxID=8319 RepID=A0AAV7N1X1_PLEWA|nr:hypothetical protein NDU88_007319 [Pleurodeles waltl]
MRDAVRDAESGDARDTRQVIRIIRGARRQAVELGARRALPEPLKLVPRCEQCPPANGCEAVRTPLRPRTRSEDPSTRWASMLQQPSSPHFSKEQLRLWSAAQRCCWRRLPCWISCLPPTPLPGLPLVPLSSCYWSPAPGLLGLFVQGLLGLGGSARASLGQPLHDGRPLGGCTKGFWAWANIDLLRTSQDCLDCLGGSYIGAT